MAAADIHKEGGEVQGAVRQLRRRVSTALVLFPHELLYTFPLIVYKMGDETPQNLARHCHERQVMRALRKTSKTQHATH